MGRRSKGMRGGTMGKVAVFQIADFVPGMGCYERIQGGFWDAFLYPHFRDFAFTISLHIWLFS